MTTPYLTMGLACLLPFMKGCPWDDPDPGSDSDDALGEGESEEEDEEESEDSDGCGDACTEEPCTWDVATTSFPIHVWPGQAVLGEIAFDGNCDLIVGGGEELPNLYRVSEDGAVSLVLEGLPNGIISGITHRASDNRIYFSAGIPDQLYALDDQDQLELIVALPDPVNSLTVAPEGFGELGNQLIAVSFSPAQLVAIDVENSLITPFAQSDAPLSVATFGNDGTLYVAEYGADRISTVTADGVFTPFYTGLDAPDGLAISPDGTRMLVAHAEAGGRIDQISIPDATLTPGVAFELSTGLAPTGIVVDGGNRVLYEMPFDNSAVIDLLDAP